MSHATIDQAIQDFFRSPTVEYYLAAHFAIVESVEYAPAARDVLSLESRVAAGHHAVSAEIAQFSSAFQLCPRFHYVHARICERSGKAGLVRTAVQRMQLCLRAISETAHGTKDSPYRITYLTDADDMVRALGQSVRCQQLVSSSNGYRDVLTAHSGEEFWFDVSLQLERSSSPEVSLAQAER